MVSDVPITKNKTFCYRENSPVFENKILEISTMIEKKSLKKNNKRLFKPTFTFYVVLLILKEISL